MFWFDGYIYVTSETNLRLIIVLSRTTARPLIPASTPILFANHHASYAAPRPPPRSHHASIDGSNPSRRFL